MEEEKRIFEWPPSSFLQPPSAENLVIRELIGRLGTVSSPAEFHPAAVCYAAEGGGSGAATALNSAPEGRLRVGRSSAGFAESGGAARLSGAGRKRKAAAATVAEEEEEEEGGGAASGQSQSREKSSKPADAPKQDFIHVRARRGQATDSHSLAERVRREKISQRMKFLQDLVPGCNKVTGKAVMLDEIINYVQSLQRQVEFLSMKLATVNPRLDLNLESLLSRDIHRPPTSSLPESGYPFDLSAPSFPFAPLPPPPLPQEQHQNVIISGGLQGQCSLSPLEGFPHAPSQLGPLWDDDLHSFGHVGFEQDPEAFSSSSQAFHDHMKIEL